MGAERLICRARCSGALPFPQGCNQPGNSFPSGFDALNGDSSLLAVVQHPIVRSSSLAGNTALRSCGHWFPFILVKFLRVCFTETWRSRYAMKRSWRLDAKCVAVAGRGQFCCVQVPGCSEPVGSWDAPTGSELFCGELVFSLWTICVLGWALKIRAFVACVSGLYSVAELFVAFFFFLVVFERGCGVWCVNIDLGHLLTSVQDFRGNRGYYWEQSCSPVHISVYTLRVSTSDKTLRSFGLGERACYEPPRRVQLT